MDLLLSSLFNSLGAINRPDEGRSKPHRPFDPPLCPLILFLREARCVLPCMTLTCVFPLLDLFCPSPATVAPGCHSNRYSRNDDGHQREFLRILHFCLLRTSDGDKSTRFGGLGNNPAQRVSVEAQTHTFIPSTSCP